MPASADVLSLRERVAYKRLADEFSRITKKCRKRKSLSIETLSTVSGLPVHRIRSFEDARVAPYFQEMLALAHSYQAHASIISRRLLKVYRHSVCVDLKKVRDAMHCDLTLDQRRALDEKVREFHGEFTETTLDAWPPILAPSFSESVQHECDSLNSAVRVLTVCAAHHGRPIPMLITATNQVAPVLLKCGDLLDRIHFVLGEVPQHLESLVRRHSLAQCEPPHVPNEQRADSATQSVQLSLAQRIAVQGSRLLKARDLIDLIRARGDGNRPGLFEDAMVLPEQVLVAQSALNKASRANLVQALTAARHTLQDIVVALEAIGTERL
jgi:hypothetical protein